MTRTICPRTGTVVMIRIIECDSTLYVGMTRKNMAALYHAYITDSPKYCLWTHIEPEPALRSRSLLILDVRLLQVERTRLKWQTGKRSKN